MRDVVRILKESTFKISNGQKVIGTCFAVKDSPYVVTASHVISSVAGVPLSSLFIIDNAGKTHTYLVVNNDRGLDVAVLKCETINLAVGLSLAQYADAQEGDEIFLCGFPFGSEYHVTHRGMISAMGLINGRQSIQVDASVNKGNSGGPCVLLVNGIPMVVGIICTRLVGANLETFHREWESAIVAHQNISGAGISGAAKSIAKLIVVLFEIFGPILAELDRFINVGFGEAVSIDYAKSAIGHA